MDDIDVRSPNQKKLKALLKEMPANHVMEVLKESFVLDGATWTDDGKLSPLMGIKVVTRDSEGKKVDKRIVPSVVFELHQDDEDLCMEGIRNDEHQPESTFSVEPILMTDMKIKKKYTSGDHMRMVIVVPEGGQK